MMNGAGGEEQLQLLYSEGYIISSKLLTYKLSLNYLGQREREVVVSQREREIVKSDLRMRGGACVFV